MTDSIWQKVFRSARRRPAVGAKPRAALAVAQLEAREVPAAYTGLGTGLVANYYADPDLSNLAFTRTDAGLDFNWGTASPAAAVPADGFSARWSGQVQAQFTETYTFSVAADEGYRLYVGGQLVVDNWAATAASERSAAVPLTAGETYDLRVEYVDRSGAANVRLSWASPSTPKAAVPASQLYAGGGWLNADLGTPPAAGSFAGAGSAYTVRGAGAVGGTADAGHFAHQPLRGDGSVVARVSALSGGAAGVMLRDGTAANAPFAAVTLTPAGAVFQARTAAGTSATASPALAGYGAGSWVKLVRNDGLIAGYVSATGADGSWRLVGTAAVPLPQTARGGLVAASGGAALNAAGFDNVAVNAVAPIGANLDAINDWSLANAFVDVFKQAREFKSLATGQPARTDINGWATEDFETIVQSGFLDTAKVYNGVYKLSFTGRADVSLSVTPGTISKVVYNPATNRTTADVTLNASPADGGWYFILQFRNTGGGVRDIKLIRPGYAADTTQTFTNEFLASIKDFSTLRFMDWGRTNWSAVSAWADRAKPTDATQSTARGVAVEYMIELANRTGKDLWVNVPSRATDEYVRQLAETLKAGLNPDRVVYLEYSNEVWNGMFAQTAENRAAAVAEVEAGMASGSPSDLFYPGETAKNADGSWASQWDWAFRRTAREITDIGRTFADVWGADALNVRVRPVVGTQSAVPYILKTQLEYVDRVYGDPSRFLYAAAGAPYFFIGPAESAPNATVDDILNGLRAGIAEANAPLNDISRLTTYYGLKHVAYEGGPDTFGGHNIAAKKAASLDPRMADLVADYLDDWYARGGGLFAWFVAGPTNYDTPYGTWGVTNDITRLDAPKAKGIEQVLAAPPVLPTIGTPVVGQVMARDYVAGANPTTDPYPRYLNNGDYRDYLVRAPQAGVYSLRLNYAQVTPGGQVQILVNDRVVTTLTLPVTGPGYDALWAPNSFADSEAVALHLNEGLNVVRLRVVKNGYTLNALNFSAGSGAIPAPAPPPTPAPTPVNLAPSVTGTAATATVTGTSVALTAAGTDDGGEAGLRYTWSVVAGPANGTVNFSANGANGAKAATAAFTRAGIYTLRVTAADAAGLTATADVWVTVVPALAGLSVAPGTAAVAAGGTQPFAAAGTDQFGQPMASLPAVTWTATGGGTVSAGGLYTAPGFATTATVTAAAGGRTASAAITVTAPVAPTPPTTAPAVVDYSGGFAGATLVRNGSAAVAGSRLRLAGGPRQAGSAFTGQAVATAGFSTRFGFQLTSLNGDPWSIGDGLTFTLQRQGATALGAAGSGLGFDGIAGGVSIQFNAVQNAIVLAAGGTARSVDLWGPGLDLRSGNPFRADIGHDGTTLTVTLTDAVSGRSATARFAVNLGTALGGDTAFAGFTAGTGVLAATIDVTDWTLPAAATTAPPTTNGRPTVTASAASATVTGTSVALTAVGADDGGEVGLTYRWTVVAGPANGTVTFSANGTNGAKAATAAFTRAGTYTLRVTAADAAGLAVSADVWVTVVPALTGLTITPGTVAVAAGGSQPFAAAGTDQFGQPMTPSNVVWSATAGTISPAGAFAAPAAAGTVTVTAASGGRVGTATVTVTAAPAAGQTAVNYAGGFTQTGLTTNGSAKLSQGRLRLADATRQAGSGFATAAVSVARFDTSFRFRMASLDGSPWSLGDGLTFTLQGQGATALGAGGSGLGATGIGQAVSLQFGVLSNVIGLRVGDTVRTVDLYQFGLDLRSGREFRADLRYDGTELVVTLTDATSGKAATARFAVGVAAAVGGPTAYAGFTAGTGSLAGTLDVLGWTYTTR